MIEHKKKILLIDKKQKVSMWNPKTAKNVLESIRLNKQQLADGTTKIEISFSKNGLRPLTEKEYQLWLDKAQPMYLEVSYEKGLNAELAGATKQVQSLQDEIAERDSREAELMARIAQLEAQQTAQPEPLMSEVKEKPKRQYNRRKKANESEVAK